MIELVHHVMSRTEYRILALDKPSTGATTPRAEGSAGFVFEVFLNSTGAFFNATPDESGLIRMNIPDPGSAQGFEQFKMTQQGMRAFIMLHELGHQMNKFGPDVEPVVNRRNSLNIIDKCFRKGSDGVYR